MAMSKKNYQAFADILSEALRGIEREPNRDRRDAMLEVHSTIMGDMMREFRTDNSRFDNSRFSEWVVGFRWIGYISPESPDGRSFDLMRFRSDREALDALRAYESDTGNAASLRLYHYTVLDWIDAKNFEDIGCPFDYPDYMSERGPRGGLKLVRA